LQYCQAVGEIVLTHTLFCFVGRMGGSVYMSAGLTKLVRARENRDAVVVRVDGC
jgi:hypothetical protein